MRIEILDEAQDDLVEGCRFYDRREPGLGAYFLDCLFSDIDSLRLFAGVHAMVHGHHRCLSKRFPFAVYYRVEAEVVYVYAILDCRRHPLWIRHRLKGK